MSPKGIIFWRHIVAIAVIAFAQHPRFYNNGEMFFGLWAGRLTFTFVASAVIMGVILLFATSFAKKRMWSIFLVSCWMIMGFSLFGHWVLPDMMEKIAEKPIKAEQKIIPPRQEVVVESKKTESQEPFDYIAARNAGLTDDEIINHLRLLGAANFDFDGALKAGYSPKDIIDYMVQKQKLRLASQR